MEGIFMKKKSIIFIFVLFFALIAFSGKVNATDTYDYDLTFYAINDSLLSEFPELAIPSNYMQKYKIVIDGKALTKRSCYNKDSYSTYIISDFEIDDEGYLKPVPTAITVISGNGSTVRNEYMFGESTFYFYDNNYKKYTVRAKVINYSTIYVDKKLKSWVDSNLKGMTELEKAKAIAKYVADNTDYSYKYQSYVSMYLYKCGDCWASTNTINKLAELAGLTCHSRNGNNDPGSGSGHRNNLFLIGGKYYLADAGYDGTKPRYYSFYEVSSPYTYTTLSDGSLKILQYDGFDTTLSIPSTINGKTVSAISKNFLSNTDISPVKITLPNTIKEIGDAAFYTARESQLKSINIPASVETMGVAPFAGCKQLTIDMSQNKNFVIDNNVFYNKDKTELIEVLDKYNGNKTLKLPNTVKKIYMSAFYGIKAVENVTLPSGLKEIDDQAFYNSNIKEITIPKNVTKIGYGAFYSTPIQTVVIENGCNATIEELAFGSCYSLKKIVIPKEMTSFEEDVFRSIESKITIYGEGGSKAETYANENSIKFEAIPVTPFIDVVTGKWYANAVKYVYSNNIIKGYNSYTFAPTDNVTRGMLVTILYRMEGEPSVSGKNKFLDVQDSTKYYYKAVKWATDKGIVNGYENGNFGPNDNIQRQQLAVILNKYAKYKGKKTTQTNDLKIYKDADKISSYAINQMKWAVGAGVISGNENRQTGEKTLNPKGAASRAEVAAMLEKYCKNIGR